MHKWIMFVLFIGAGILGLTVLLMLPAAPEGEEEAAPPPVENITVNAAAAEAIYKQSCVSCHGGNLEGGVGPSLQKAGERMTAQEIQRVILMGRGGMMPAFKGKLSEEEIANMAAWLAEHK